VSLIVAFKLVYPPSYLRPASEANYTKTGESCLVLPKMSISLADSPEFDTLSSEIGAIGLPRKLLLFLIIAFFICTRLD
jgi:hypothetical protein